jgi:ribonucleoside-triphosphate reductase (thioredoxin)
LTPYEQFIHLSRYARHVEGEARRETWSETVDRYIGFWLARYYDNPEVTAALLDARQAILDLEVMPSMRCLMTAGPALEKDHMAGYNCAFVAVDDPRVFDETLYVLMCGTGVGFSVERQFINQLPTVSETFHDSETVIHVPDSKVGWASSFRDLVSMLYAGKKPKWDLSRVRPAGARLKTFGGRASGPEPLDDLFRFATSMFEKARGRKLNSLECHDLMCKIAQIVVVGGVRRSALISLSNLSDQRMAHAKDGEFFYDYPQRSMANNSVCYTERPDFASFFEQWFDLYRSRSGERGMFNRVAARNQVAKNGRRDVNHEFGCNPCSEIILRPQQLCNLTEVVVRDDDNLGTLRRKVRIATFLGTLQSTLTDFRYVRSVWKNNCDEERLLGVSLTGIMDHSVMSDPRSDVLPGILSDLRNSAIEENQRWAATIGINASAAITCVKPSGTVSQLVNSASGIHPRYSRHYIRRVRADQKDPLALWMQEQGVPCEPDKFSKNVLVFSFPVAAPGDSVTEDNVRSLDMLDLWKVYQDYWCEHKPSVTIHYTEDEFLSIGQWVWDNLDAVSGISFLPKSDHVYQQAPYEAIDEDTYRRLYTAMPEIDFTTYREPEDQTIGSQEFACTAGVCEVVDITA